LVGYATTVYEVNGRELVVIGASGGGHLKAAPSDVWLAFALPEKGVSDRASTGSAEERKQVE